MKKQKYSVLGMTCSACQAAVERSVNKLEGVASVSVNLLANSMNVEYDESATNDPAILAAVQKAGYQATLATVQKAETAAMQSVKKGANEEIQNMKRRFIVSCILLAPLMYISMGHMAGLPVPNFLHGQENAVSFALTQLLLTLPIVFINRVYFLRGFPALLRGHPNMDSLIAIGSAAALIYGVFALYRIAYGAGHAQWEIVEKYSMDLYFESSAMILTLITLGKFLETRSKGKTSEAIAKLIDLAPKTATVLKDGAETTIPVENIAVGDLVVIRPGQSVPVDGVITEGSGVLDQSAITGESLPVSKKVGERVTTATINQTGYFVFRAEKVGADTTLAQIVRLVEEAGASKAPIAKLADKISGVFVPIVISIAIVACAIWLILGQSFEFALSIGISVLVISCPCALGLATPVAIMVGTGKGAANNILIKSAEALETMHEVQTIVLDKTGTITEGKPRVTDILPHGAADENALLSLAASLERPSEHPIAHLIVKEAQSRNLSLLDAQNFKNVPGRGVQASINQVPCFAGNLAFMQDLGIAVKSASGAAERLADEGKTPLYFASGNEFMGLIAVADTIKPSSQSAVSSMARLKLNTVMLTGDNERTAHAIQKQLQIGKVIADVLPQEKEAQIRLLQQSGQKVAMVGDGINDAPALARADVGIAIGAGTDIAIESADIVLVRSDLNDVVTAVELSRAVIRNIRQNLFWAFFYNCLGIPLAAGALVPLGLTLSPMFAAAAMSLSSVFVVTNALRLRNFKPSASKNIIQQAGGTPMYKIIQIEGMSCVHCKNRVEEVLSKVEGATSAEASVYAKNATVTFDGEISEDALKKAVEDAGYQVTSIR